MKTDEQKKVFSKFMILCWATFIAILGCMWPMGHGVGTPDSEDAHKSTKNNCSSYYHVEK